MVTIHEHHLARGVDHQAGLLRDKVDRDMENVLNEYGAPIADQAQERKPDLPRTNFAYGIPMAGVRYYTFV